MTHKPHHIPLKRELNVLGATMMGLGSILGTGIFVSIGIAAGVTGPSVILAILLAAIVATCNALSSAQLAASHSVSGGTYEYGYRYLHPWLGFTAGWMFLCAKTASAATAAIGFSSYLLHLLHLESTIPTTPIAVSISTLLTLLVLFGIKKSNHFNIMIVSITLLSLISLVIAGLPNIFENGISNLTPFFHARTTSTINSFFYATALMFVAYTGYARIATLAEEVKNPRAFIPRAIIMTLIATTLLYILVAFVAINIVGSDQLGVTTQRYATPLENVAHAINTPGLRLIIAIGACSAMLSVLLNLILGLSRVTLAMGRKSDLPRIFAQVSAKTHTPTVAVIGNGIGIIALTLIGNVEITWSFSAFTVLIYYAITNLAALRLPKENQLYLKIIPVCGLISCLFLAFWVPLMIWISGLGLILIGLIWHQIANKLWQQ